METAIAEVDSPQETTEGTSIENASTEDIRNALGITPETAEPTTGVQDQQPEAVSPEPEAEAHEPEELEDPATTFQVKCWD